MLNCASHKKKKLLLVLFFNLFTNKQIKFWTGAKELEIGAGTYCGEEGTVGSSCNLGGVCIVKDQEGKCEGK